MAEGSAQWTAATFIEALDGADRKLLLAAIADDEPELVMLAATRLAEWRASAPERHRKAARRHEHDRRRRRRRSGLGDGG